MLVGTVVFKHCFNMPSPECFLCWKHLKTCGQTRKHCFRNKNVSELAEKDFCFLGRKFCFRNNDSRGGQTGNIDRKHNVSATMFPSLSHGLENDLDSPFTCLL